MPNVLSPRDLVSRPDNMDETVTHICTICNKGEILHSGGNLHPLRPVYSPLNCVHTN